MTNSRKNTKEDKNKRSTPITRCSTVTIVQGRPTEKIQEQHKSTAKKTTKAVNNKKQQPNKLSKIEEKPFKKKVKNLNYK